MSETHQQHVDGGGGGSEEGNVASQVSFENVTTIPSSSELSVDGTKSTRRKRHITIPQLRTGIPLYSLPVARFKWGEHQGHCEHAWASLFFDLVYVALAFQLSHMFAQGMHDHTVVSSLGMFIAIYSCMEALWTYKLQFDARFEADDLFHRVLQLMAGSVLSFQTNTIASVQQMGDHSNGRALAFSCCLLLGCVIDLVPYFEMKYASKDSTTANMARRVVLSRTGSILLFVVPSIITSAVGGPFWLTCLFWFLFALSMRVDVVVSNYLKLINKSNLVPMHVEWGLTRIGEFLMLMLGESIISIVISGFYSDAYFISTYFFCYFLIATMALVLFASLPNDPNKHAMRRSAVRGILYMGFVTIQGGSLVLVGTGFKLILTRGEAGDGGAAHRLLATDAAATSPPAAEGPETTHPPSPSLSNDFCGGLCNPVNTEFVWLLSAAQTTYFLATFVAQSMHHGIREEVFALKTTTDRTVKFSFWTFKIVLTCLALVAPAMTAALPWQIMFYFWALSVLIHIVQLADQRYFKAHHDEHVKREVDNRNKLYQQPAASAPEHSVNMT